MRAEATIGVYRVPDPSRCGIVQVDDDGWVMEFIEKPKIPKGNLAFSGILLTTSKFLDTIPAHIPADIGFDVLPRIARLAAYQIDDYLIDVGTMENYRSAQENWRRANTHITQEQNA
jgi:mannose-1-phosphate guanylyltransferase